MSADKARDWDKELADIDKIIAQTPPGMLAPGAGAPAPARGAPPAGPVGKQRSWSTWLRVLLGAALAAGMTQWPYFHGCGPALFIYLGAIGVVVLSGGWGAVSSWNRRLGLAHVVSLLVVLWGCILAAGVILPRIGYAKSASTWWCP